MAKEETGKSTEFLRSGSASYRGPDPAMYRMHAISFLVCAEKAVSGYRRELRRDPNPIECVPLAHLICHAAEMLLKLSLFKTGADEKDLRAFHLRHNLSQLRAECEARGVTFSDETTKLIESLSPLHEHHILRYSALEKGPINLPFNPMEMIAIAKNLLGAAHPDQSA